MNLIIHSYTNQIKVIKFLREIYPEMLLNEALNLSKNLPIVIEKNINPEDNRIKILSEFKNGYTVAEFSFVKDEYSIYVEKRKEEEEKLNALRKDAQKWYNSLCDLEKLYFKTLMPGLPTA